MLPVRPGRTSSRLTDSTDKVAAPSGKPQCERGHVPGERVDSATIRIR